MAADMGCGLAGLPVKRVLLAESCASEESASPRGTVSPGQLGPQDIKTP